MRLSIHSPDELVAVIPHLLGFKPEESIVCLTADREEATVAGHDFAARFDTVGIDTHIILWADESRWADLDTGDMGLQTEAARERLTTATVLTGRAQLAANRDSLAESLVGDREPVAALLPETREAARDSTAKLDGRWALARMQRFHRDGLKLSDADAARLLVAVESILVSKRWRLQATQGESEGSSERTKRAIDTALLGEDESGDDESGDDESGDDESGGE